MTYSKFVRKATILPVLIAIGLLSTTPFLMNVDAAPGGNNNGKNGGSSIPTSAILPDISPGVPKHLDIHNQQQNEWLRFTNVWGNVGVGGLEFEPDFLGGDPVEGQNTLAFQNLYDAEGEFRYSTAPVWHEVVSEFTFHETHNHWHIDGIGEFSVRHVATDKKGNEIPGDIAKLPNGGQATAVKVGFCISDVYQIDGKSPATSQKWYWECEVGFQGIQPGWIDQYHQSTEDNEIDITGLPNGTYFLTHTWNPLGFFVDESSENDSSWMKFELSDQGNGNRKITELESFAPECKSNGSTPGLCGDINKNS
jgi:hypothetical protein